MDNNWYVVHAVYGGDNPHIEVNPSRSARARYLYQQEQDPNNKVIWLYESPSLEVIKNLYTKCQVCA